MIWHEEITIIYTQIAQLLFIDKSEEMQLKL